MRLSVVATCLSLCLIGFSIADDAHASVRKETNIPAEGLGPALNALAKDRNFQIVYVTEEIANVRTEGAVGELTTEEALKRLLTGTGLTYRYLDEKTVTIGFATTSQNRSGPTSATASDGTDDANANKEGKKSVGDSFRLAQANQGVAPSSSTVGSDVKSPSGRSENSPGLTEIIVTAEKKSERLQDVPVPVTVISADTLLEANELKIQDYFETIPGINWGPGNFHNSPLISIRGITTGAGNVNPTVGVTVDDVPFGSTTGGNGGYFPDIDPSDLARVEVLRGPQGTLYGASSMGGLVKYVTVEPSTDRLSGHIQAGTDAVQNGAGLGYSLGAAVNIPIDDTLAARVSGYARQDAGYIDGNAEPGLRGVNQGENYGGHLAVLWSPSSDFTLKFSAMIQTSSQDGSALVVPTQGDLKQNFLPDTGSFNTRFEAYSATITAKLWGVDLTSITAYNFYEFSDSYDLTSFFGPYNYAQFGQTGSPLLDSGWNAKTSQEIRLSDSIGGEFDWQLGGFFTHEHLKSVQQIYAATPNGGVVDRFQYANGAGPYQEFAAFANGTYHFTDRFDIQIGGRRTEISQANDASVYIGPTGPASPSPASAIPDESSTTYLVTPRFRLTPDVMVYARLASGYRPGGGNVPSPAQLCVIHNFPCESRPDSTRDYEIGAKADFLDHRLTLDASLYYIDWRNIQLQLQDSFGDGYTSNAGRAKSQGIEYSMQAKPVGGLTLGLWVDWDDAVLTQAIPSNGTVIGANGDRLPYSSRYSGSFTVNQDFPITSSWNGFVGGAVSYVGNREGLFATQSNPERQYYPGFTKTDLRAGAKYDSWTVNLYANNVGNVRGLVGGGLQSFNPTAFNIIQPRTIGLSVLDHF